MNTTNKNDYPEVFSANDELTDKDIALFRLVKTMHLTRNEREFFARMQEKEEGECAPSADLLMDERHNADAVYIVRYFYDEYRIGRRCDIPYEHDIRTQNLADALNSDLFALLNKHMTLWEWLRQIDFVGINYNGNFILNRH